MIKIKVDPVTYQKFQILRVILFIIILITALAVVLKPYIAMNHSTGAEVEFYKGIESGHNVYADIISVEDKNTNYYNTQYIFKCKTPNGNAIYLFMNASRYKKLNWENEKFAPALRIHGRSMDVSYIEDSLMQDVDADWDVIMAFEADDTTYQNKKIILLIIGIGIPILIFIWIGWKKYSIKKKKQALAKHFEAHPEELERALLKMMEQQKK